MRPDDIQSFLEADPFVKFYLNLTDGECFEVSDPAQVSSLTQPQMGNLSAFIKGGGAALLFDDPFPAFNPRLAPGEPKQNPNARQMGEVLRRHHQKRVLGAHAHEIEDGRFLECIRAESGARNLSSDQHDRHRVGHAVANRRDAVCRARS